MSNPDLNRYVELSCKRNLKQLSFPDEHEFQSLRSKIELELEQATITAEMIANLDKTLRTRAINYKRDGHHEVYENTMSLYQIIFGREM